MNKENTAIIYFKNGQIETIHYDLFHGLLVDDKGKESYSFFESAGSEGIRHKYKAVDIKKIELHVADSTLCKFEICVMSINSECNQERGPFNTIEEAKKAALKWKGKHDRFGFDYFQVDIYGNNKYNEDILVESILL